MGRLLPRRSPFRQADTGGDAVGNACDSTPDGGAQCNDGLDNDGDGFTDFPEDPGCTSGTDTSESPNPIDAPTCDGRTATIYVADGRIVGGPDSGQLYSGTLRGTDGPDVISGTLTAGTVMAGGGDDVVCGGGGKDKLFGEGGNDNLSGGAGADMLRGKAGDDTLTGGDGADRFFGGPGRDTATDYNRAQGDTLASVP